MIIDFFKCTKVLIFLITDLRIWHCSQELSQLEAFGSTDFYLVCRIILTCKFYTDLVSGDGSWPFLHVIFFFSLFCTSLIREPLQCIILMTLLLSVVKRHLGAHLGAPGEVRPQHLY
jgi:hypothetical protein